MTKRVQDLQIIYILGNRDTKGHSHDLNCSRVCCDMDQSDTIGKIELIPSIVLSSDDTDCKNDIQLFPQLFDELSVHTDYH